VDEPTRRLFDCYGADCIIDRATDTVYIRIDDDHDQWEDAASIAGHWYLLYRRHRTPAGLRVEIQAAGLDVLHQEQGHPICAAEGANVSLLLRQPQD